MRGAQSLARPEHMIDRIGGDKVLRVSSVSPIVYDGEAGKGIRTVDIPKGNISRQR
jgi:hypothetical protein